MFICTERALFTVGSAARERMAHLAQVYGDVIDSIVFSTRAHGITDSQELATGAHAHPTNSRFRLWYGRDAVHIAKRLSCPDIISAQDPFETGLVALCIARYFKVPLVVEMHTDFLSPSFVRHSFLNRMRVLLAGYVLRRATGGYAVSDKIKQAVSQRYHLQMPIYVLPIYVDTQRFASLSHVPHPRFKTALLWVGRMEQEKHPEYALDAFIQARRKGFDVGLTFVGIGRLLDSLKAIVHVAGVAEWVEFVGNVSDVAPYYAKADLVLVTSAYEGYGMIIVEALAAGVPVLSTEVGIAKEAGAVIAGADYAVALCDWLASPRTPGVLKLQPYASEEEYFSRAQAYYQLTTQTSPV